MGDLVEGPWLRNNMEEGVRLRLVPTEPAEPRTCYGCVNATFGENGTYCTAFTEWIDNEQTAGEDCPLFEGIGDD